MPRGLLSSRDPDMRRQERRHAAAYLLPTLVLVVALIGFPMVYSLLLTVTGPPPGPGQLSSFVGLDIWKEVFGDPLFVQSLRQTAMYLVPSMVIAPLLALSVALVLNERFPGRTLVRGSLLIPWAMPPVVVASMFQTFLDDRRGLLGHWLVQFGIVDTAPQFFSGIPQTLYLLTAIHIWKTFPLLAIIFLVALQYLPDEQIQAARIDGAGYWRRLRFIVLPHLRPTIIAGLVVQFLVTVTLFDIIFALTGGGPGSFSTYNVYYYSFVQTFQFNDFNAGAATAYVVSALTILFALLLTRGRSRLSLA